MDISRAFESDNGMISDNVVVVESLLSAAMSEKPVYSGDYIQSVTYYNSLTQIDANRILKVDLSYSGDNVSLETWTIYKSDGTSVYQTITRSYAYSGDIVTNVTESVT